MKWLVKLLSKDNGASFGRVGCAFIIAYVAAMTTVIILKADKVPAAIPDLPYGWVTVIGILWGVGKLSEAYIAGKKEGADAETA